MRPGDDPTAETTEPPAQQPDEEPAATKKSEPTGSETAEKVANKPATPVAIARKPVATPTAKQEPEEPNLQEYKADTKTTVKPLAPILPPNSTVTVRTSTLRIDCANGSEVPADW
jgi:hypothetical protein